MPLLVTAAFFAEYELPDYCPSIGFVPVAKLRCYICPGDERQMASLYFYGEESLLIDNNSRLDDVFTRSIILHELVHFPQDRVGEAVDRSCKATLLRDASRSRRRKSICAEAGSTRG